MILLSTAAAPRRLPSGLAPLARPGATAARSWRAGSSRPCAAETLSLGGSGVRVLLSGFMWRIAFAVSASDGIRLTRMNGRRGAREGGRPSQYEHTATPSGSGAGGEAADGGRSRRCSPPLSLSLDLYFLQVMQFSSPPVCSPPRLAETFGE